MSDKAPRYTRPTPLPPQLDFYGWNPLPPTCLRVLAAVLELARTGTGTVTVRGVMRHLGLASTNAVHPQLVRLRDAGLVHHEPGTTGTLRPACRFEPVTRTDYQESSVHADGCDFPCSIRLSCGTVSEVETKEAPEFAPPRPG